MSAAGSDAKAPIRLLCVATDGLNERVLQRLCERAGAEIELVAHFGSRSADFKASSLRRLTAVHGREGHLMQDDAYAGANRALVDGSEFPRRLVEFIDHMHRSAPGFALRTHDLRSFHDYVDYYHVVSDAVARLIEERGVNLVLFFNVPHLGYDTVIEQVARARGIRTLLVSQSLFPDRFFSTAHADDWGSINPDLPEDPALRYPIDRSKNLDLFYMKSIRQEAGERGGLSARGLARILAFVATQQPLRLLDPFYLGRLLKRARHIGGSFPKWRDPFARFFHIDSLAYFEQLAEFEDQPVDYERRFVYFPMHLQPEMTTSALGGRYVDQALAIEHLSALLPDDFLIYVKEHPWQSAMMRGPLFFHRLRRIAKVRIMPSYADTVALTERAAFVATVTGTAGWEAVRKGRKALVFGQAWYQDFPGVFKYTPSLRIADILAYEVDHDALERTVGRLLEHMHRGVVERHYAKIVPDFDDAANVERVAGTLLELIRGSLPPLFQRASAAASAATTRSCSAVVSP